MVQAFQNNILNIYGKRGEEWLKDLPEIVHAIACAHNLSDLKPVDNLSYNYVLSGFQGIKPIILKLSLNGEGLRREAYALKAFTGFGAVKVVDYQEGTLLLERAISGVTLKSYFLSQERESIDIVSNLIKSLHRAPIPRTSMFPHIKEQLLLLDKEWNIPDYFMEKARRLKNKLLETLGNLVLLHGDLHHDNILKNGQHWVTIDPKGFVGEAAYEVIAFIRNPIPELLVTHDVMTLIGRRITAFSHLLGVPAQRILDWSVVQSVLAWTWSLEDRGDVEYFKKLTQIFDKLKVET